MEPLYPVYAVRQKGRQETVFLDPPAMDDESLESKKSKTSFFAYTDDHKISFSILARGMQPNGSDYMELWFDPAHSGRRPHNMKKFRLKADGMYEYEEFRYEFVKTEPNEKVEFVVDSTEQGMRFTLSFPRVLIGLAPTHRVVGLNILRNDHTPARMVKWSGLPNDVHYIGQGMGDLLLTEGLEETQIRELITKSAKESENAFTRWQKSTFPDELLSYVTKKTKGHTVRMNRNDCDIAYRRGIHTKWGRQMKQSILAVADYWADKQDRELFDLVPVGNPRASTPGQYYGHPIHGGNRSSFLVCLERPYEYYHPETDTWLSNGDLLKNPTTGEPVLFEDDGSGFIAPEGFPNPGVRYMFTASYRLFLLSMLMARPYCPVLEDESVEPSTTGLRYSGAISNLAYAYILTKEKRYAYKAAILIGRIAELLPYMNGNYGDGSFSDTVHISEPSTTESHWLSNMFEAMDLIYDAIFSLEPDLQAFFSKTPDAVGAKRTKPFSVKDAVSQTIPYLIYSCELEKPRISDWSMRYMYLQLVLASYMQSGPLMKKALFEGQYCLQSKMRNLFFRDGRYAYDSVGYVEHICLGMMMLPNTNYRFCDSTHFEQPVDMFEDKRYGLTESCLLYFKIKSGGLIAMFGDTHADNFEPISTEHKRGILPYQPAMEILYHRMPSATSIVGPILARFSKKELQEKRLQCVKDTYLNHSLLLMATASDWDEYQSHLEERTQPSFLMEDSEISILRSGTDPSNTKHVVLYGQPSAPHVHGDKLGLWIGAYGYHLLAAAGGYPFTWVSPKIRAWELHSSACIVTVIDGKDQNHSYSQHLCHMEGNMMQMAAMYNDVAYPNSPMQRRCILVTAPDGFNAYVVDIYDCENGRTFDYQTAGLDVPMENVSIEGISSTDWTAMQGTVAGEDVPMYSQPGPGWQKAVKRMRTKRPFAIRYSYQDAGLRIHAIPSHGERTIMLAQGERGGEQMKKSRMVPFVIWRDESVEVASHKSTMITVMEPYQHADFIDRVIKMPLIDEESSSGYAPAAVEIDYTDGRKDIVIANAQNGRIVHAKTSWGKTVTTDAKALLLRYGNDTLACMEAFGYTMIQIDNEHHTASSAAYTGKVESLDLIKRTICIRPDTPWDVMPKALEGRTAVISSSDYEKPSLYKIHNPAMENGRFRFSSSISLIKMDTDRREYEKRWGLGKKDEQTVDGKSVYVDIKPGDTVTIYRQIFIKK